MFSKVLPSQEILAVTLSERQRGAGREEFSQFKMLMVFGFNLIHVFEELL